MSLWWEAAAADWRRPLAQPSVAAPYLSWRSSVGSFTANGTAQQRAAGIVDDPLQHEEDAGKFAAPEIERCNNSALRTYFLSHAAETLHWLMDKGLTFYGPNPEPPNRVPRMHNVVPAAKAYIAVLEAELLQRGATIIRSAHVTKLIHSSGRITGVEYHRQDGPSSSPRGTTPTLRKSSRNSRGASSRRLRGSIRLRGAMAIDSRKRRGHSC